MLTNETAGTVKSMVPIIVEKYMSEKSVSWDIAIEHLYNSELYKALENSNTLAHHLDPSVLCGLLVEERESGRFSLPEVMRS